MSEKWVPAPYMLHAVKWLLEHGAAGIFADPGLRKTSIVLAALKILLREHAMRRTLILAPLRPCYGVWNSDNEQSEICKWSDFNMLRSVVLHGSGKDRKLQQALRDRTVHLFVMNPEGLPWLMTNGRFRELNPDGLVVDESTMFKNTQTQRFKYLEPVLEHFRRRWILTGTPSPNGLLDLFGQAKILDLGRALGRYVSHYRLHYFNSSGYGGYTWTPKKNAEEMIYKQLKDLVLRIDERDAGIHIPPVVDVPMYVQLDRKARKVYDTMETQLLAEVRGNMITAANVGVAMGKCAQIANGALYLPERVNKEGLKIKEPRRYQAIHDAKLDALAELREELSGKSLIAAYYFEHDLERIRSYFDEDLPAIGGHTNAKQTQIIERDFNARKIPLLLMQSGSTHGLNPQAGGNHIAWFGLTFNYEHYDQTIRRLRRSGQKAARVWNHLLLAQNTVDEVKLVALRSKERTQSTLLDALRAYAHRRRH